MKKSSFNFPSSFLADLEKAFLSQKTDIFSSEFMNDLTLACQASQSLKASKPEIDDETFSMLETRFQSMNKEASEAVAILLQHVSANDPIRCSISLFEPMDFGRLETAHTRTLAWLIDPRGRHAFGDTLVNEILKRSSNIIFKDLQISEVKSEVPIQIGSKKWSTARLDILAEGEWTRNDSKEHGKWVLVIEAKIDANESERQLEKYDLWIEKQYDETYTIVRMFLTDNRRTSKTALHEWNSHSFEEIALWFMVAAREHHLYELDAYPFLRYYIAGVLADICRWVLPISLPFSGDPYILKKYCAEILNRGRVR